MYASACVSKHYVNEFSRPLTKLFHLLQRTVNQNQTIMKA